MDKNLGHWFITTNTTMPNMVEIGSWNLSWTWNIVERGIKSLTLWPVTNMAHKDKQVVNSAISLSQHCSICIVKRNRRKFESTGLLLLCQILLNMWTLLAIYWALCGVKSQTGSWLCQTGSCVVSQKQCFIKYNGQKFGHSPQILQENRNWFGQAVCLVVSRINK